MKYLVKGKTLAGSCYEVIIDSKDTALSHMRFIESQEFICCEVVEVPDSYPIDIINEFSNRYDGGFVINTNYSH